ncbi:hypothetical protein GCM10011504_09500 [Siccirubricoccus deserti]|uniref:Uncharacterized protein n=1 Tax=Siccirubricoccus deserti TaxID=2013562 RepID=A0A9X0QV19_9PROT|nr:hypothetical protein [Siccirubricoccus deserti]MBC4014375.1 hypothetical protein [Siccirubricoccus deserti]GGC33336.1 hypothetical protein GCM10011504_09500 [Siccirubricoccus deserti]
MAGAGAGLVRVHDIRHYSVLQGDAAASRLRLYHVTGGRHAVVNAWHRLRLEGDRFMAWFDDAAIFEARDGSIPGPDRIALWFIAGRHTPGVAPRPEVLR